MTDYSDIFAIEPIAMGAQVNIPDVLLNTAGAFFWLMFSPGGMKPVLVFFAILLTAMLLMTFHTLVTTPIMR